MRKNFKNHKCDFMIHFFNSFVKLPEVSQPRFISIFPLILKNNYRTTFFRDKAKNAYVFTVFRL